MNDQWLLILADLLLILHVALVAFVILGLAAIFMGGSLGWSWIRNLWFRLSHLGVIAVVVLQAWLGLLCPLTSWEMALRQKAGDAVYEGSFIQHWLHSILYYSAPEWVFITAYSLFGALVLISWLVVRPRRRRPTRDQEQR